MILLPRAFKARFAAPPRCSGDGGEERLLQKYVCPKLIKKPDHVLEMPVQVSSLIGTSPSLEELTPLEFLQVI